MCSRQKRRQNCKYNLIIFGIILLLCGSVLIAYNWNLLYNWKILFGNTYDHFYLQQEIGGNYLTNIQFASNDFFIWGSLFSGIVTILLAIYGICTAFRQHPYCAIPGGCLALGALATTSACGIYMALSVKVSLSPDIQTWRNIACNNQIQGQYIPNTDLLEVNGKMAFSFQYFIMVEKIMCSYRCPCSAQQVGTYFTDIGDDTLRNAYKRTINPTQDEMANYNAIYFSDFSFNYSQIIPIYLVDQSQSYFTNYKQCFEYLVGNNFNNLIYQDQYTKYAWDQFVNQGGYEYFKKIELQQQNCAGFCSNNDVLQTNQIYSPLSNKSANLPLFSLTKYIPNSLNDIPYSQDCVDSLYSQYLAYWTSIMSCSLVLIATSLFLIIYICSLCTYCVRRDEDDAIVPDVNPENNLLQTPTNNHLNTDISNYNNGNQQKQMKFDFLQPHQNEVEKIESFEMEDTDRKDQQGKKGDKLKTRIRNKSKQFSKNENSYKENLNKRMRQTVETQESEDDIQKNMKKKKDGTTKKNIQNKKVENTNDYENDYSSDYNSNIRKRKK